MEYLEQLASRVADLAARVETLEIQLADRYEQRQIPEPIRWAKTVAIAGATAPGYPIEADLTPHIAKGGIEFPITFIDAPPGRTLRNDDADGSVMSAAFLPKGIIIRVVRIADRYTLLDWPILRGKISGGGVAANGSGEMTVRIAGVYTTEKVTVHADHGSSGLPWSDDQEIFAAYSIDDNHYTIIGGDC